MDFPRLTSGSLGALNFSHVNEIFRRIENLENDAAIGSTRKGSAMGITFLARITALDGSRAAFVQVARNNTNPGTFDDVAGGATSRQGDNEFFYPIHSSTVRVNQVVPVCARRMTNGDVVYEAIGSEPPDAPYIITGHEGNGPVWRYFGKEARWDGNQRRFYEISSSNEVVLLNGAENPIDTADEIGVGTKVLDATPFTRRPIKPMTVVVASRTKAGELVFSVPNGYEVICQ